MGRLEYATERSVQQATKTIAHLLETRYKNEVLYRDAAQLLDEENKALVAPREKFTCTEKVWLNTLHLLQQATGFSIAGDLQMWRIKEGELQEHQILEPTSDKTVVQAYLKGRRHLEAGELEEAKAAYTKAIDRFPRHALALERRGFVNYTQGNNEAALADYAASIAVDSKRPEAYLGRARMEILAEDWAAALEDLTQAMKRSMPHHHVYLEALHRKGKVQMEMGAYKSAIAGFNFFLKRPLLVDHPQYLFRRQVAFDRGLALAASGNLKEAIESFDLALEMPTRDDKPHSATILLHRGLAVQQSGQKGFIENWRAAAEQGSKKAAQLLEEVS
ncbi:MAG: tetratricopeptide repeat protein [Bacteroidota bacterium]